MAICDISGTLFKTVGLTAGATAPLSGFAFTVSDGELDGQSIGNAGITITTNGSGAFSFAAEQGTLITVRGNFTLGDYDFRRGIRLFVPYQVSIDFDSLLTPEDYCQSLGTSSIYAPATASFILKTAHASLPNAQALGSLATGMLKNTTTTGVLSIAAAADLPLINTLTTDASPDGANDYVMTYDASANAHKKVLLNSLPGGGGGGGGAVSSVFGRTGAVVAALNDYTWALIDKTTSSLADITTRSASDLSSGTLPDGRFPATLPAVSGANLTNLNASNLAGGTVPLARLSGISNAEISVSAAIALSKLAALTVSRALVSDGSGVVSVSPVTSTELGHVAGVTAAIQTQIDAKQASDADLTAIAALSPANDDIIQRKAGAWTNRTPSQFKTDLALTKSDVGLGNVENTALSTWAGSANITTLGTIVTGVWNGSIIGSNYGGAGTINGLLKANGSGVVSAAAAGTDYVGAGSIIGNGQTMATGRLLGCTTASSGAIEEITPAATFSFSAGALDVAANGITNAMLAGSIANAKLTNSSLTVTAGSGLTGGGSISLGGSATLNIGAGTGISVGADDVSMDINGLTEETSIAGGDFVAIYDVSASALRKMTRTNFVAGLSGGGSPGGSNTQLQYNNSSAFGGVSGATSDGTNVTFGTANLRTTSPRITTDILDANGNSILRMSPTASATQSLALANNTVGNVVSLIANAPTAAAASQAGTGVEIAASAATAGTSTAGAAAGGSLTLRANAAARLTSGNANGGSLIFIDGLGVGTGVRGGFAFGGTSSSDAKLTIFSNGYSAPSFSLQTGAGADSLGTLHSGTASYGAAGGTGALEIAIVGASGGRITVGGGAIGFASASATGIVTLDGNRDTEFTRAAARVMSFGNGTAGHTFRSLPDSPAQITADQNNYQAGSGRSYFYRLSSDASRSITGLNPVGGTNQNGETHILANVGSNNIVLVNESASSTAGNRFTNSTGADITLAANEAALVWYDGTSSRWRVFKL